MKNEATNRAAMPEGTSVVLDRRTLQKDYSTLLPVLKSGMRVLDIGCGTAAISKGIAEIVGEDGYVVAIDKSEHLIAKGKENFKNVNNLELIQIDLFDYSPVGKFDLIILARVLQWFNNPKEALFKIKQFLKPEGQISILDFNHQALEWEPEPPVSMKNFYRAFLKWRTDAGMDNEIAEHLPSLLKETGFREIDVLNANETYRRGENDFFDKVGIWSDVAKTRGKQMVENGYVSEEFRLQTIEDYDVWLKNEARSMIMKLNDVRARMLAD